MIEKTVNKETVGGVLKECEDLIDDIAVQSNNLIVSILGNTRERSNEPAVNPVEQPLYNRLETIRDILTMINSELLMVRNGLELESGQETPKRR